MAVRTRLNVPRLSVNPMTWRRARQPLRQRSAPYRRRRCGTTIVRPRGMSSSLEARGTHLEVRNRLIYQIVERQKSGRGADAQVLRSSQTIDAMEARSHRKRVAKTA